MMHGISTPNIDQKDTLSKKYDEDNHYDVVMANPPFKGNIDKATGDHFYHLTTCPHYKQIVLDLDIGEQFFCTEKEAKEAGFAIASECLK